MTETDPDLDAAYALETPEDNRALYRAWAQTYDAGFAVDMDYQLPRLVAEVLMEVAPDVGPVLDVGAGTGLLAECLGGRGDVDALDISAEMLEVAAAKGIYARTIVGDLTGVLDMPSDRYGAVVSSGTFTHGHVGPDALDELLRVAQPGAWFVLSVNAEHFEARGFAAKFAAMAPRIAGYEQRETRIYGAGADAAHVNDLARIVVFRKS